jgi:peptide/nickel transport system substrate-binding protein
LGVSLDPDAFFLNQRPAKWSADPRGRWINTAEFRQALSHAVDREAYARTVFLGAAVPVHGPVSPGNKQWFWPDIPRLRWDQDRSKLLLEKLGLTNRDADPWLEDEGGTEARFTVLVFRGNSSIERGVQVLSDYFRAVGVALDVVPLEPGAVIQRMLAGDFDAIFFNYISTDTDPAMQGDLWLSSGSAHMWNPEQKAPATEWERQIDELMARQAATSDQSERVRLFREVQKIFAEQVPVLYFAAPRLFIGVSARLRNESPGLIKPQLLWSADTLAVAQEGGGSVGAATAPSTAPAAR